MFSLAEHNIFYQMPKLEITNDPFDDGDALVDHPVEAVVGVAARGGGVERRRQEVVDPKPILGRFGQTRYGHDLLIQIVCVFTHVR